MQLIQTAHFKRDYKKLPASIQKRTATRDLTGLVNVGLLEKHGEKKGTYYRLKLFTEHQ
jgi:Fic family protein